MMFSKEEILESMVVAIAFELQSLSEEMAQKNHGNKSPY